MNYKCACAKRASSIKLEDTHNSTGDSGRPSDNEEEEEESDQSNASADTSSNTSSTQCEDDCESRDKSGSSDLLTPEKPHAYLLSRRKSPIPTSFPDNGQVQRARYVRKSKETVHLDGPLVSKLTLTELSSLVKLATSLPSQLPELTLLRQFITELAMWRQAARQLIYKLNRPPTASTVYTPHVTTPPEKVGELPTMSADVTVIGMEISLESPTQLPSVAALEQMLRFGDNVSVELPELRHLRRIHECLTWLESVDQLLDSDTSRQPDVAMASSSAQLIEKPCLNRFCQLQLQGDSVASAVAYVSPSEQPSTTSTHGGGTGENSSLDLSPQTVLDAAMAACSRQLLAVICTARDTESRLSAIINAKHGSLSMEQVLVEIEASARLPVSIPLTSDVEQLYDNAKQLMDQFNAFKHLLVITPFCKTLDENFGLPSLSPITVDRLALGSVDCTVAHWQSVFDELVEEQSNSPIIWPEIDQLRQLVTAVCEIRHQLVDLFVRPKGKRPIAHSNYGNCSLLEVMLPRPASALDVLVTKGSATDVIASSAPGGDNGGAVSYSRSTCRRNNARSGVAAHTSAYVSHCKENAKVFVKAVLSCTDAGKLYETTYEPLVESELSAMLRLRDSNMVKSRERRQHKVVYCLCRKPSFSGFMLQCEVCRDWFHGRCVSLPKLKNSETDRLRYICPRCECTLRPDLSRVLDVLNTLYQTLPCGDGSRSTDCKSTSSNASVLSQRQAICLIQIPEIAATQLLCERAFKFMHHLHATLACNRELQRAVEEFERFAGVKMPSYDFVDVADESRNRLAAAPADCCPQGLPGTCVSPPLAERNAHAPSTSASCLINTSHTWTGGTRQCQSSLGGGANDVSPESRSPTDHQHIVSAGSESQYSPQDLVILRRQPRKSPLLIRPRNSSSDKQIITLPNRAAEDRDSALRHDDAGEVKVVTEAAEALAGLSASLVPSDVRCPGDVISGSPPAGYLAYRHQQQNLFGCNGHSIPVHPAGTPTNSADERMPFRVATPECTGSQGSYIATFNCADAAHQEHAANSGISSGEKDPKVSRHRRNSPTFRVRLSTSARRVLYQLVMQASLLEVSLPQTLWLWQLHLASESDSDNVSAVPPQVALREETKVRRRILRYQLGETAGRRDEATGEYESVTESSSDSDSAASSVAVRNSSETERTSECGKVSIDEISSKSPSKTEPQMFHFKTPGSNLSINEREQLLGACKQQARRSLVTGDARKRGYGASYSRPNLGRPIRSPVSILSASAPMDNGADKSSPSSSHYGGVPKPSRQRLINPIIGQRQTSVTHPHQYLTNRDESLRRPRRRRAGVTSTTTRRPHRGHLIGGSFPSPHVELASHAQWQQRLASDGQYSPPSPSSSCYSPGSRYESILSQGYASLVMKRSPQDISQGLKPARPMTSQYIGRDYSQKPQGLYSQQLTRKRQRYDMELLDDEEEEEMNAKRAEEEEEGELGVPAGSDKRVGRQGPPSVRRGRTLRSDEEEEEADCSAGSRCRKPRTGTVAWIACDQCEGWYHQVCVGIQNKAQVPKKYYCTNCRKGLEYESTSDSSKTRGVKRIRPMNSPRSRLNRPQVPSTSTDLFARGIASRRPVGWASESQNPRRPMPTFSAPHHRVPHHYAGDVLGSLLTLEKGDELSNATYRSFGGEAELIAPRRTAARVQSINPDAIESYSPIDPAGLDDYQDDRVDDMTGIRGLFAPNLQHPPNIFEDGRNPGGRSVTGHPADTSAPEGPTALLLEALEVVNSGLLESELARTG